MQIVDLSYQQYTPLLTAARFANQAGCVFLDSAAQGTLGRYSFLAADPFQTITSKDRLVSLTKGVDKNRIIGNPWTSIQELWTHYRLPHRPDLPPFQGGLLGYWGYDLGRHTERLPAARNDDLAMPDLWLGAYDWVIAWDHQVSRCWLISTGLPESSTGARQARAEQRAMRVIAHLERMETSVLDELLPGIMIPPPRSSPAQHSLEEWPGILSTFTQHDYCLVVQRALDYIYAGDIYQVNLSQRFEAPLRHHPWHLYLALRHRNPANFAAYLHCGASIIASASPERFLRLDDKRVETRPIKGTIARSADQAEDRQRAFALQTSAKDRAENLMIVDLLRNDLGRVCEIGSVAVPELWAIEQYPTVYHLVSTVIGQLRAELTPLDLLQASFPGGSITGAPKIRAMEIIAELEPTARGVYCGAIGYVGWNGQMDTNITIRTLVARQGRVTWQAGGGIVADSTPEGEYQETLAKARALSEVMLDKL